MNSSQQVARARVAVRLERDHDAARVDLARGRERRARSRSGGGRSRRPRARRPRCPCPRSGARRRGSSRARRPRRGTARRRSCATASAASAFCTLWRPGERAARTRPSAVAARGARGTRIAEPVATRSRVATQSACDGRAVGDRCGGSCAAGSPARPGGRGTSTAAPQNGTRFANAAKRVLERLVAAVVVEVLGVDVGDDRDHRREAQERAVALVGLGDEQVAAPSRVRRRRARPRCEHAAADHRGRVEARARRARARSARSSWSCRGCRRPRCRPSGASARRASRRAGSPGSSRRSASTQLGVVGAHRRRVRRRRRRRRRVAASWPIATAMPSERSRSVVAPSRRSEPVTR